MVFEEFPPENSDIPWINPRHRPSKRRFFVGVSPSDEAGGTAADDQRLHAHHALGRWARWAVKGKMRRGQEIWISIDNINLGQ